MDDFVGWLFLAALVFGGPWALAIAALVKASRAQRRAADLEARAAELEQRLARAGVKLEAPRPPSLWGVPAWPAGAAGEATAATAPLSPAGAGETAAPAEAPVNTVPIAPAPSRAAPVARPPEDAAATLEERIALVWFSRAGALALLAGTAYFFKYAVDNDWIGPAGRVALGALAGAGALAAGEVLRPRTRALWVNAVQGAGIALLLVSTFAAASLYALVPFGAGFAAVGAIALAGAALALRGRSELALALALAGGLAAPVLLSTGEDRPGGLLGWLLAVSALALGVSVRLRLRVVPWLALAGTALLFGGWHERFFRVQPPPEWLDPNLPASVQMGAYFPLAARALPLALALAHVALWCAAWLGLTGGLGPRLAPAPGRPAVPRAWADAWLGAALVAAHLAPFSLLFDRPLAAGAAVALAGVAAAALAGRARRPELLAGAAALGGLLLSAAMADARPAGTPAAGAWIAAAAAWAAVHLGAAARLLVRHADPARPPPAPALLAAVLAGLGFAGLSVQVTTDEQGLLRALLAGGAGAALLALGAAVLPRGRARATVLLGAALGLVAAAAAFLLSGASVTLAWAALAATVAVLAARDRDPAWLWGAKALFLAAAARLVLVDAPGPERAREAFLYGAGAAGALAPPFLLNARALALAGTAAALLLAARAIARAAGAPGAAEGARAAPPWWRISAGALAAAGHLALLALAVAEARGLALALPAPPPPGDAAAFEELRPLVYQALAAQAGKLDTVTTITMALYAALLVGVGFAAREVLHRWLGLGLFAATLGKLLLLDVWRLARVHQILVFLALGVLLLGAAFLYARHGRRILGLLRDGGDRGGGAGPGAAPLALLLAGLALGAGDARALDASPYATARPITGVGGGGLHAVRVDVDLWRASLARPGTLADVRVEGPGGAEIPWALRPLGGRDADEEVAATLVDPVALEDGTVRATLDKGRGGLRSDLVALDLDGEEFLREVRVEASEDGATWGAIAEGGRVYGVKGVPGARRTEVRHPPSDARFLRVVLLPGPGAPRVTSARAARRPLAPPPADGQDLPPPARAAAPDGKASLLDVDLGAPGLPASAVVLRVGTPAFERTVRVLGSDDGETWVLLGAGIVWRLPRRAAEGGSVAAPGAPAPDRGADPPAEQGPSPGAEPAPPQPPQPPAPAPPDEELRLGIEPAGRRHLRLEIRDGDAPPLAVTGLRVEWRAHELVLSGAGAGAYTLLAGAKDVPAPAYDLAAVLARLSDAEVLPAALGPPGPNPRYAPRDAEVPFTERHRVPLGIAVALLLAGLAAWAIRLLRAGGEPPASG